MIAAKPDLVLPEEFVDELLSGTPHTPDYLSCRGPWVYSSRGHRHLGTGVGGLIGAARAGKLIGYARASTVDKCRLVSAGYRALIGESRGHKVDSLPGLTWPTTEFESWGDGRAGSVWHSSDLASWTAGH